MKKKLLLKMKTSNSSNPKRKFKSQFLFLNQLQLNKKSNLCPLFLMHNLKPSWIQNHLICYVNHKIKQMIWDKVMWAINKIILVKYKVNLNIQGLQEWWKWWGSHHNNQKKHNLLFMKLNQQNSLDKLIKVLIKNSLNHYWLNNKNH